MTAASLANGDLWIEVNAVVSASPYDGCDIREDLLVAEAERALRRDGIPVRGERSLMALLVSVVALPSNVGCAVSVDLELDHWVPASALGTTADGWIRAFEHRVLWMGPRTSRRARTRETVEEFMSILANRLRREVDTLRRVR